MLFACSARCHALWLLGREHSAIQQDWEISDTRSVASSSASDESRRLSFDEVAKQSPKATRKPNNRLLSLRVNNSPEEELILISLARVTEPDYLVHAAHFISSAQKAEAEGAQDLAFSCYKSAVNLMLKVSPRLSGIGPGFG